MALLSTDVNERWTKLAAIMQPMHIAQGGNCVYCYFAHLTEDILQSLASDNSAERRGRYRYLLNDFDRYYRSKG